MSGELYQRVVVSSDPERVSTCHYEYERDEQAERNAALGAAVREAIESDMECPQDDGLAASFCHKLADGCRSIGWETLGTIADAIGDALAEESAK